MPKKKALWLADNFGIIDRFGGLVRTRDLAFAQQGTADKIAFLRQFHGIGKKYARNIWMDVYDPDFRSAIAVDERIKRISEELGVAFSAYEDHEKFYQAIARETGLEPWEVDRLLYQFRDRILKHLAKLPPNKRLERTAEKRGCSAAGCLKMLDSPD